MPAPKKTPEKIERAALLMSMGMFACEVGDILNVADRTAALWAKEGGWEGRSASEAATLREQRRVRKKARQTADYAIEHPEKTHQEIGDHLGISSTTVGRYLRSKHNPYKDPRLGAYKLTRQDVREILTIYNPDPHTPPSQVELARRYGVCAQTIVRIVRGDHIFIKQSHHLQAKLP